MEFLSIFAYAEEAQCEQSPCHKQVFSNTASSLPAELGPDSQMAAAAPAARGGWTPAKGAAAWRQRLAAHRRSRYQTRKASSAGQ